MDRLFSKYADPFSFLKGVISMRRLSEFVNEFWDLQNEKTEWDFYLHKVFNQSFEEWKASVKGSQPMSEEQLETTISDSKTILFGFVPK